MTWGYDNHEARVTCDHHGCDARVTHPVSVGCEGVSACTYAAERALSLGWDVPSDIEHSDLCPTHRGVL